MTNQFHLMMMVVMIQHPLKYDLLIFDADGTLRVWTIPGQRAPDMVGMWRLMPNVKETLALYDWGKVGFSIVTNQSGIGLGYLSYRAALSMLVATAYEATGLRQADIRLCPHVPYSRCRCRKPMPTMIRHAVHAWGMDGTGQGQVLYVGDRDTDRQCAEAAGVDFMWAQDFFGWRGTYGHKDN